MKEQVNVEIVEFVTVNKEKYDRLKRLDENVKSEIAKHKIGIEHMEKEYLWHDKLESARYGLKLLESLDK